MTRRATGPRWPARRATAADRTVRLGLVGRGRWGANIERTLGMFSGVSVIAVTRGAPFPEALDGVLVATPPATHADVALPYIDRGIATFIEKPMATAVADAERLREATRRSGAPIFVGHIYLYNPAFRRLLELVPRLGTVRYVLCEGTSGHSRPDASALWEWLPHHLAMGRVLLGRDPASAETWLLSDAPGSRAAATRFLFGRTPLVSMAALDSPVRRRQVTVCGESGTAVFDDTATHKLALHDAGGVSFPTYGDELPLTVELRAFLEVVRGGAPDRPHADEGAAIVRLIAAAEESGRRNGRPVAT